MSVVVESDARFLAQVREIAVDIAAAHAGEVDREARFPAETVAALREARALSAYVPTALGGAGVSLGALAQACLELGRSCAASAMVFAMHQIEVVTIVRHLEPGGFYERYLRELTDSQRLIASITSEVGTGGDMGRSIAAIEPLGDGVGRFRKEAPTISYCDHADDFFSTVRRAPDAEPGDQVLVLTRREQMQIEPTGTWDPLGMRGTCSPGGVVTAEFPLEQVLEADAASVMPQSLVPVSHVLWSHIWLGIATDAFDRARAFVRASAKRSPGAIPPAASRLSALLVELSLLRGEVGAGLRDFVALSQEPGGERLASLATVLRFNSLKVAAAEQAPRVCQGALGVCGIVGYKNDTPFSVGRHLRDAMSASLMVANERIHQTNASLLLISKDV